MILGIDIGSNNLGVAILEKNGEVINSFVFQAKEREWEDRLNTLLNQLERVLRSYPNICMVAMEMAPKHCINNNALCSLNMTYGYILSFLKHKMGYTNIKSCYATTWRSWICKFYKEDKPKQRENWKKLALKITNKQSDDEAEAILIGKWGVFQLC